MQRGCGCVSALIFFLIFFTVGAGLSFWGWTILQDAWASTSWPSVSGRVVESDVSYWNDEDGNYYRPEVTFEYTVAERQYESSRIGFGSDSSYDTTDSAWEVANRYPTGETVPVYYDPDEPATAVLEPGATAGSYTLIGVGAVFVLVAVVVGGIIALATLASNRLQRRLSY
jgi:hypothetical protein